MLYLGTVGGFLEWTAKRDLPIPAGRYGEVLALRAGLRATMLAANGGKLDHDAVAAAQVVLGTVPLRAHLEVDAPLAGDGLAELAGDGLAALAAAWVLLAATGDWRRLKRCPDHECGWVFWDGTRSRTRRWMGSGPEPRPG